VDARRRIHRLNEITWREHFALALWRAGVENRRVLTLTEPQVWTLIGVFGASIFGIQGIAISSFRREMQSIRNELKSEMSSMRNELITRMDSRFDQLDRDVQFLMRKEFD